MNIYLYIVIIAILCNLLLEWIREFKFFVIIYILKLFRKLNALDFRIWICLIHIIDYGILIIICISHFLFPHRTIVTFIFMFLLFVNNAIRSITFNLFPISYLRLISFIFTSFLSHFFSHFLFLSLFNSLAVFPLWPLQTLNSSRVEPLMVTSTLRWCLCSYELAHQFR